MWRVVLMLACAGVLAPIPVEAVELPVSYLVEFKAFKSGVSAGDQLSFELYGDLSCQTLVHNEVVTAGSPRTCVLSAPVVESER